MVHMTHERHDWWARHKVHSGWSRLDLDAGLGLTWFAGGGRVPASLDLQPVSQPFAEGLGDVFADGFVEVGEDVQIHQPGQQVMRT